MEQSRLDKQHHKGKLHAAERIMLLMDKDTFTETYTAPSGAENIGSHAYDGVITGFGKIRGKKVYVYSQDFTVAGGALGWNQGFKIARTIEAAIGDKCPVIGINDSGGARIQEGIDALAGYGEVFYNNTLASGYIPQIAIIAGPCAGGAVYSPALMDFTFFIEGIGKMFLTGPKVIKSVSNTEIDPEVLGGAQMHAKKSGVAAFRCASELDCYSKVRDLIDLIPSCFTRREIKSIEFSQLNIVKKDQSTLSSLLPTDSQRAYNVKDILRVIVDDNTFLEVYADYAKNLVTAFAKIGDMAVGIVANQPKYKAGVLDCDSSDKAARFIRFCDNYNIPLITFTDVPGFMPGLEEESKGVIRHGAKILYAYSEATTIKINIILRKAFGGAYVAMSSKHLRADRVYAWPQGNIAVMNAEAACAVIYNQKLKTFTSDRQRREFLASKVEEYKMTVMGVDLAHTRGFVDSIIKPEATRTLLIHDIMELTNKARGRKIPLDKKHGNMPL